MGWSLLAAAAALFLVAAHPFITYPLSLALVRRWRRAPIAADAPADGSLAVCFCAYKEAGVLRATLDNLLAIRERLGQLQIMLYIDGSTDGTAEIAREYQDRIDLVISSERRGKTYGLNRLLAVTDADYVIFTDANVILDADGAASVRRYFADPDVGCVCGHLQYVNGGDSTTASVGSLYWRLEERIKQLESDTGSVMGADGSIYAIRRRMFRAVPQDSIDDMYISFDILRRGGRLVRAPELLAFEESATKSSEEFNRKVRIGCQAFGAHLALWASIRKLDALTVYKYVSHKLVRWLGIVPLALSALCAYGALVAFTGWTFASAVSAAGLAIFFLGARLDVKPFSMAWDILLSFVATAIGVWRAMRGVRVRTWEPANSIRKSG